ncbi:hypothetical protein HYT18_04215 [Candidatus Microgenomates bacterium]|nr:hypothetical protein [Candidatus Microgenomates bacterium]
MMILEEVREKYPEFIYEGFEIKYEGESLIINFDFKVSGDFTFRPKIVFPNVSPHSKWEGRLDNLIFNLGMVELLSYWKAVCSPQIVIKAGYLSKEQIKFWKKLLLKGLGEFFYNNKIDFTKKDLVEFTIQPSRLQAKVDASEQLLKERDLILIGGGKDSAVTLEQISKSGKEFNCLMLNPTKAVLAIAKISGCKNPIIIKRTIDPKLLELNKKGYLNGHTPFSAYLAFLGTLAGVLYDYKNIVVSNEVSSDEENILWMGQEINHQYSKTSEFEKDFRSYSEKYLTASTNYFSFLRDKGELEISRLFARMPKYHKLFRSCNKGSKQGVWCGECPKCISTYLTLYPFLGSETQKIFGKDLLSDESLIPIVKQLLRENNVAKPFECVATVAEIKNAISLGRERAEKEGGEIPKVLRINV